MFYCEAEQGLPPLKKGVDAPARALAELMRNVDTGRSD